MNVNEMRAVKQTVENGLGEGFVINCLIVSLTQHDMWLDEWYSADQEIDGVVVDTTAKILSIDDLPVIAGDVPQDLIFGVVPE